MLTQSSLFCLTYSHRDVIITSIHFQRIQQEPTSGYLKVHFSGTLLKLYALWEVQKIFSSVFKLSWKYHSCWLHQEAKLPHILLGLLPPGRVFQLLIIFLPWEPRFFSNRQKLKLKNSSAALPTAKRGEKTQLWRQPQKNPSRGWSLTCNLPSSLNTRNSQAGIEPW